MKLLKSPATVLSLLFLILICTSAIFAPSITPYHYAAQNIAERLQEPSTQHWMGTDALGRDLYSRMVFGARLSLSVGFLAAFAAFLLGLLTGSIAGYWGGWRDTLLMRMVDLFYAFPAPLCAILLMLFFGRGFMGIFLL